MCKMPFECRYFYSFCPEFVHILNAPFLLSPSVDAFPSPPSSSLEVCTTSTVINRPILLTVCKLQALKCMGNNHVVADDSVCKWPKRDTAGCRNCHMWERCDGGRRSDV